MTGYLIADPALAADDSRTHFPPESAELVLSGVSVGYPGEPLILKDVNLSFKRGCKTAILGSNGSGKTTLLRCLSGAQQPARGSVLVTGNPLRYSPKSLRNHRTRVQLVLQNPEDQLFAATVQSDVAYGPTNLGLPPAEVWARVSSSLAAVSCEHLVDRPVHRLSGGEKRRVTIAGALALNPSILLLDEPTAGVDPEGVDEFLAVLDSLHQSGITILMSTHDVDLALSWADNVVVLSGDSVVEGPVLKVLADDELLNSSRLRTPTVLELHRRLVSLGVFSPSSVPRTVVDLVSALSQTPEDHQS